VSALGINLSFAVKRWPEPEAWSAFVRDELGLDLVQFSFDLLDPWWPDDLAVPLASASGPPQRATA
jgi:D-erythrulose 1-phosphate 3-epimerase